MGIRDRLRRLEAERGPNLCEACHCLQAPTFVEIIHYPDGSEERLGDEPSPLCQRCPYCEGGGPIRHVEVVKRY
jgi:hypothetical protein